MSGAPTPAEDDDRPASTGAVPLPDATRLSDVNPPLDGSLLDGSVLDGPPTADERHAAHVAALLALPLMGPHRLERVLAAAGSAEQAWRWATDRTHQRRLFGLDLRADPARLGERWADAAAGIDPWRLLRRHRQRGVRLLARGTPFFPGRLNDDPEPPALLFALGRADALVAPTVAIVGTRRATSYGLRLAAAWGRALSEAGVAVISGLASGIDAAAHEGALRAAGSLAAAPVAVVGSGLDVVYPSSSATLWQRVGEVGLLLGEAPLGAGPEPWRFPARNRIIAGLADVVVVIESHRRGGSLLTVEEACLRQRTVLAVPGSVHSPASAGTLQLIAEGCAMATTVDDVLDAMPRRPTGVALGGLDGGSLTVGAEPADDEERALLDALGWEPALLDDLVERTGWSLGLTCAVLERLLRRKLVSQQGAWLTQEGESMSG